MGNRMGKSTDAALGGTVYTEASETVNSQSEKENEHVKGHYQLHPLCPGNPCHCRFWYHNELVARVVRAHKPAISQIAGLSPMSPLHTGGVFMIEVSFAQLRLAASLALGLPFPPAR
jgi:hypothetical protein